MRANIEEQKNDAKLGEQVNRSSSRKKLGANGKHDHAEEEGTTQRTRHRIDGIGFGSAINHRLKPRLVRSTLDSCRTDSIEDSQRLWVIRDGSDWARHSFDVCFAPKATELLRRRELTPRAICGRRTYRSAPFQAESEC